MIKLDRFVMTVRKSRLPEILLLLASLGAIFYFRVPLEQALAPLLERFRSPCQAPIHYSIGTFDTRFGLSRNAFIADVDTAAKIWETPIKRDLFVYDPKGDLKINLVFDSRQASTLKVQALGLNIHDDQAGYNTVKTKYNALNASYAPQKAALDALVAEYNRQKAAYETAVAYWNAHSGAPKNGYQTLNQQRGSINTLAAEINQKQTSLNQLIDDINSLVTVLNRLAHDLNLVVNQYNTIGATQGTEFEQGLYSSEANGQRIDIFQFDDQNKLIRVLAHELGHALGLEHLDDPTSIMYRLNEGGKDTPSGTDITQLKTLCGIK